MRRMNNSLQLYHRLILVSCSLRWLIINYCFSVPFRLLIIVLLKKAKNHNSSVFVLKFISRLLGRLWGSEWWKMHFYFSKFLETWGFPLCHSIPHIVHGTNHERNITSGFLSVISDDSDYQWAHVLHHMVLDWWALVIELTE